MMNNTPMEINIGHVQGEEIDQFLYCIIHSDEKWIFPITRETLHNGWTWKPSIKIFLSSLQDNVKHVRIGIVKLIC